MSTNNFTGNWDLKFVLWIIISFLRNSKKIVSYELTIILKENIIPLNPNVYLNLRLLGLQIQESTTRPSLYHSWFRRNWFNKFITYFLIDLFCM